MLVFNGTESTNYVAWEDGKISRFNINGDGASVCAVVEVSK